MIVNKMNMKDLNDKKFNAIILGVTHKEFIALDLSSLKEDKAVVYDVKGMLSDSDCRL